MTKKVKIKLIKTIKKKILLAFFCFEKKITINKYEIMIKLGAFKNSSKLIYGFKLKKLLKKNFNKSAKATGSLKNCSL